MRIVTERNIYRTVFALVSLTILLYTPAKGQIFITSTTYYQNFDYLINSATSNVLPDGWAFIETGTNANVYYTANNGSLTNGDTYSFGVTASTDRAFGGLQSTNLIPTFGASFINNTGSTINAVSYTHLRAHETRHDLVCSLLLETKQ